MSAGPILIIGYGNTLRGDDGLGPAVAAAFAGREPQIRSVAVQQLTPELAEAVAAAGAVIYVDAQIGLMPAVVVTEVGAETLAPLPTHVADPRGVQALAWDLFGRAPPAWLVTVAGVNFELGETLSATAQRHAAEARGCIERLIHDSLAG
jgi:hydrogenase maturation protease